MPTDKMLPHAGSILRVTYPQLSLMSIRRDIGNYGRWSFAEFTDIWEMQDEFEAELEACLSLICKKGVGATPTVPG